MPETATDPAPTRRRLALPLTLGLALWASAHYVFFLPGASDSDGVLQFWALATQWLIATTGLALAIVCGYQLARRLGDHLDHAPQPERPAPTSARRRSPAIALIAAGAALSALAELPWIISNQNLGLAPWVVGLVTVTASLIAPAMVTLGVYLALRRLEDHLDGRRPDQAPTAPHGGGEARASGDRAHGDPARAARRRGRTRPSLNVARP